MISNWPDANDVIRIVREQLIRVNAMSDQLVSDGDWTKQVFSRIADAIQSSSNPAPEEWNWVGYAGGFQMRKKGRGGEWLYDFSWLIYERHGEENCLRFPLALESEWNPSEEALHEDFLKLVTSKAEVLVFVHQGSREQEMKLAKQADKFITPTSGQRLIFARWESFEFHFREWSPKIGFAELN